MSLAWLLGLFLLFAEGILSSRFGHDTRRTILALAALLGVSHAPRAAQAETLAFNAQTLRPAMGPAGGFVVEGTLMPKRLWPLAPVVLEYANQPLRHAAKRRGLCLSRPRHVHGAPYPRVGLARFCVGGYRYSAGPLPGL